MQPSGIAGLVMIVGLMIGGCAGSDEPTGDGSPSDGTAAGPQDDDGNEPTPEEAPGDDAGEQRYPDVIDAELEPSGEAWRLSATISSPYDTPERYADAFRAVTPQGEMLGVRELAHDHADEQPFTRSLDGLVIPDGVGEIVVEGRDRRHGWGGETVTVPVPDR